MDDRAWCPTNRLTGAQQRRNLPSHDQNRGASAPCCVYVQDHGLSLGSAEQSVPPIGTRVSSRAADYFRVRVVHNPRRPPCEVGITTSHECFIQCILPASYMVGVIPFDDAQQVPDDHRHFGDRRAPRTTRHGETTMKRRGRPPRNGVTGHPNVGNDPSKTVNS